MSTLPILKMELIQDGRNDYNAFYDMVQNSTATFKMTDLVTGGVKLCKPACFIQKDTDPGCGTEEYYVGYKFENGDTNKPGVYIGQFTFTFLDGSGTLIVPIRESLYIHVLDGLIKK